MAQHRPPNLVPPLIPPDTPVDPTIESFYGHTIYDPYRWLEDTASPDVLAWFKAQNAYTRSVLDALPGRAALHARLVEINRNLTHLRDIQIAGGSNVYLRRGPNDATFKLFLREGQNGAERLLLDPARFDIGERAAAIEYFSISPNGKRLAVGLAAGGTEDATIHLLDVATLREIGAPIPRARGADPVWRFDGEVLFYTQLREQKDGEPASERDRHRRAYMRNLANGEDVAIFGSGVNPAVAFDADDMPSVHVSPVSPYAIGVVSHGVQNELSIYVAPLTQLRGAATPWRKLAGPERGITDFDLRGEWIYLLTNENAPRYQIARWSLRDPRPFALADAEIVVPTSERVVRGLNVAKDALYVQETDGEIGVLRRLEYNVKLRRAAPARTAPVRAGARSRAAGKPAALPKTAGIARGTQLQLPARGAIQELATDPTRAGALVKIAGWTLSPSWYDVDGKTGAISRTDLLPRADADWSDVVTSEFKVKSHDGAEVPLTIVYPRNAARDGSAPLLLEAYGAYGISLSPRFWPSLAVWLERGGVYAVAHVRGGGELGADWHHGGYRDAKPNAWRDLIAAAQWLIDERWTAPPKLAIMGSSAGGLTVSNAMIERPELFAAMVSQSGFHDALRSEAGAAGPANVPEFGTVETESGLVNLLAMSSYARVEDGVRYPAAMLTIGFQDARVDPWDPGKMAARLQSAQASLGGGGQPVLLRVDFDGGHGTDTPQEYDETTDLFAFLLWRTGAPDFALP
ncbi:MAG TPA: prolyl oligopeptidase family serine peptidase [Casimicrobiaceae bacterium]|nr:prolyl oligopeptidase family serine peptidase [Casimicrobiaceae bacterium]